jgi:hypothetical protein
MKPITVVIDPRKLIRITSDDGGYLGGHCLMCGQGGWIDNDLGYAFGSDIMSNRLIHTRECPLNEAIGKLKGK